MDVIALAGGYGTRLGDLTLNTPKALLNVGGQPLLNYTCARLAKIDNIGTVYIVSNEKFYQHFVEWEKTIKFPFKIKILNDKTTSNEDRLGSVGDLAFAIETQNITDSVLLIGTDNFFTFDLNHVILRAKETDSTAVGLYDVKEIEKAKQFGIATVDEHEKIIDFVEKPKEPKTTLSLMLLWYLHAKDFVHVRACVKSGKADRAGDFIHFLIKHSQVYGVTYDKPFYDVGSLETYNELNNKLNNKNVF